MARIWRVDVGRVPLFLLDTDWPENDADRSLDHRPALRRGSADPPGPVRAARRRRRARAARARDRARADPSQRGSRRVRAARARGRGPRRRAAEGRARRRTRADRLHHPHTGPRRQRHLHARGGAAGNRAARARDRMHAGRAASARPRRSGGRGVPVRDDRGRSADGGRGQRREPAPRRGLARDVEGDLARPGARGHPDRPRDQRGPRAELDRTGDTRAAQPPSRRGLAAARARCRNVGAGGPHSRRGAVGRARAPARRPDHLRAPPQRQRPSRPQRHLRLCRGRRPGLRRSRPHDRLRPARGDLQAARPAHPRSRVDALAARPANVPSRSCWPARHIRRTRRPSVCCRACSA